MSSSPSVSFRRLSNSSNYLKEQEALINEYEAEEERIINVLSRKLEQLREEKIDLENTLEMESESHVNRLSRQLSLLRMAQQAQMNGTSQTDGPAVANGVPVMSGADPAGDPSLEVMLDALRRENEQLRNRLSDIERDYIRVSRFNEIYREELIEHRNRLGQSVDNLIGLSSPDSFSRRPIRHRSTSSLSSISPSTSVPHLPSPTRPVNGVPIPRPPSQIHRPINNISESNTPLSHSPTSGSSASESPFSLSSPGVDPASYVSNLTNLTTPPSSASFHAHYNAPTQGAHRQLSYPSVPPPSLSSSFGSPTVSYHIGNASHREQSLSPVEPLSRRNSNTQRMAGVEWRVAETGNLRSISASRSQSRRASIERGGRVAETGTLVRRRSRAESHGQGAPLPSTTEAPEARDVNTAGEKNELDNDGTVFA